MNLINSTEEHNMVASDQIQINWSSLEELKTWPDFIL